MVVFSRSSCADVITESRDQQVPVGLQVALSESRDSDNTAAGDKNVEQLIRDRERLYEELVLMKAALTEADNNSDKSVLSH